MTDGPILLCPNPHRDEGLAVTRRVRDMLLRDGHRVVISPLLSKGKEDTFPDDIPLTGLSEALKDARLLITLGGDGTMLRAAAVTYGTDVPLLGVNMGHKGFLTQLEPGEIERLRDAAAGRFLRQPRMMLEVELIRNGRSELHGFALNDAVINGVVNTICLAAFGDDRPMLECTGDGLIVSSPTGATGYSMSAGGPLVEPDTENLIITPICAHQLAVRSFVLAPHRRVTIRPVELGTRKALLSLDGDRLTPLQDGDEIRVCRAGHVTVMALLNEKTFYDTAYEKLSDRKER